MKVRISVAGVTGVALLDSGSSHNFIDVNMAQRAGVRLIPCPNLSVTVANGDRVASPGKALAQSVHIGNEAFDIDFYALPLGAYDMVLGVQWLSSLGPILWNFAKHTMCFARWKTHYMARHGLLTRAHVVIPDEPRRRSPGCAARGV